MSNFDKNKSNQPLDIEAEKKWVDENVVQCKHDAEFMLKNKMNDETGVLEENKVKCDLPPKADSIDLKDITIEIKGIENDNEETIAIQPISFDKVDNNENIISQIISEAAKEVKKQESSSKVELDDVVKNSEEAINFEFKDLDQVPDLNLEGFSEIELSVKFKKAKKDNAVETKQEECCEDCGCEDSQIECCNENCSCEDNNYECCDENCHCGCEEVEEECCGEECSCEENNYECCDEQCNCGCEEELFIEELEQENDDVKFENLKLLDSLESEITEETPSLEDSLLSQFELDESELTGLDFEINEPEFNEESFELNSESILDLDIEFNESDFNEESFELNQDEAEEHSLIEEIVDFVDHFDQETDTYHDDLELSLDAEINDASFNEESFINHLPEEASEVINGANLADDFVLQSHEYKEGLLNNKKDIPVDADHKVVFDLTMDEVNNDQPKEFFDFELFNCEEPKTEEVIAFDDNLGELEIVDEIKTEIPVVNNEVENEIIEEPINIEMPEFEVFDIQEVNESPIEMLEDLVIVDEETTTPEINVDEEIAALTDLDDIEIIEYKDEEPLKVEDIKIEYVPATSDDFVLVDDYLIDDEYKDVPVVETSDFVAPIDYSSYTVASYIQPEMENKKDSFDLSHIETLIEENSSWYEKSSQPLSVKLEKEVINKKSSLPTVEEQLKKMRKPNLFRKYNVASAANMVILKSIDRLLNMTNAVLERQGVKRK